MDQKSWLWRKKSSEKSIVIRDKTDLSLKENEGQVMETHVYFLKVVLYLLSSRNF